MSVSIMLCYYNIMFMASWPHRVMCVFRPTYTDMSIFLCDYTVFNNDIKHLMDNDTSVYITLWSYSTGAVYSFLSFPTHVHYTFPQRAATPHLHAQPQTVKNSMFPCVSGHHHHSPNASIFLCADNYGYYGPRNYTGQMVINVCKTFDLMFCTSLYIYMLMLGYTASVYISIWWHCG